MRHIVLEVLETKKEHYHSKEVKTWSVVSREVALLRGLRLLWGTGRGSASFGLELAMFRITS